MHRVVRAGTKSLDNCMFFYIMVLVETMVSWD